MPSANSKVLLFPGTCRSSVVTLSLSPAMATSSERVLLCTIVNVVQYELCNVIAEISTVVFLLDSVTSRALCESPSLIQTELLNVTKIIYYY